MSILTLHREPTRHAYFQAPDRRPLFFEESLDCWVAADRDDVETVLQSRSFSVVALSEVYERFEETSGQRFPNLIFALRHIPLGLNDDAHRDMRRRMAELIVRRREAAAVAIPELIERWLAPVAARREVELVDEVLFPLVASFMAVVTETKTPDVSVSHRASMIFDRMIGLRTRLELEKEIGAVRGLIRASLGPDAPEVEEGLRLALFALGNDTLVGTIGESLYRVVSENEGLPLAAIPFPEMPVETGVPYVERIAGERIEIGGVMVEAGERVRVLLQSFAYSPDPADRSRIFGAGLHACLGRQLSIDLWRAITTCLSRMPVSATVVEHKLRNDNFVFTCPAKLVLRINP